LTASARDRQLLVVGVGADAVGVTDGDDDFQVDAGGLGDQVVQLGLGGRLQVALSKSKKASAA
jgi:hypothetical protein